MNTRIEIELKYAPGKISLNFGRFVGENVLKPNRNAIRNNRFCHILKKH